ncbi:4Fe-4S dicluster domain-containing protein [Methanococcus aeolicus]|uniref:4Fe-4S ferredoxin iron-sulfur binding domain protein n=1 Tax=Methanococcus aeolicus (strain ATCC BAA-1280 / DSM 17508 / OCM 812 / Nankai-3) TaxID=419665 RepID=A6UX23_META3|nr:4Fe-4S binding protein [Methanococcus aeolicus]ABR57045.1 4Fe-4S ferredoxin iron-sulfur binding domain protein [Methanococcus aeolicus Nankai-3]UXM85041.1 4Fe-4S binding protein [Methanococcus aeolicus]
MIYIDEELCKGCILCVKFCPKEVLKMSEQLNKKGVHVAEVEDITKCTYCNICEMICPDQAIAVRK